MSEMGQAACENSQKGGKSMMAVSGVVENEIVALHQCII